MSNLSLCIIVKNEEASLRRCLNSVRDVVDQIILLDTGSTDHTVEIAQELGAKVYHFEWCNDFAAARNQALKYVTSEWVLVLDADEVLIPSVVPLLKGAIANENNLVINLIRQELGATQSPYSLVSRLFRRHPDIQFSRPYHETIDDSVIQLKKKETNWQIVDLNTLAIDHYGYTLESIASLDKYNRAKQIMESYLADHLYDAYICSKLGALYLQVGELENAMKLLKRGLKSNNAEPAVLFELYYSFGNAYTRQKNADKAAESYKKAILQPILPQLKLGAYLNLGSLLQKTGQIEIAKQAYETAIKIDPQFSLAYYNLGTIHKALGHFQSAISAYKKAIELSPNYAYAYQNLGVVLYKLHRFSESIEAFKGAIALHESQNPSEAHRLRLGLQDIGLTIT